MKQNYTYKWNDADWFLEPQGSNEVKKKLDSLNKYLKLRSHLMSRYEVRLYEWILKKQYKADPIQIIDWVEEVDSVTYNTHRVVSDRYYYLGYYNPARKYPVYQEDEYSKEQQKYRARHSVKMG